MKQSALAVRTAGFCTITRRDTPRTQTRYDNAADAAMALVEVRERYLRLGEPNPPIAWFPCDRCSGFHLTSTPRPVTVQQGPRPRSKETGS